MDWIRKPISQIMIILCAVGAWLLLLAAVWVCSLPRFWEVPIGMIVGFALMCSYSITQIERAQSRRLCSIKQAQLSSADVVALRKLLPDFGKSLMWVPDHTDAEARWINAMLKKIWPHFKEASCELIKMRLQDSLNKYRSQMIQQIQVTDLELGNSYPYIQEIKVLREEGTKLSLEFQFDWRQNENQQVVLHVLTAGPEYTVQVKHFVIYGIMKLTFVSFTEQLPCFGALVFSIMGQPLIDFRSRFLSGDLQNMPEIEKAVDSTLLATLMDLLVWPSRVVIPVIPGDYSTLEATSVGFLYVKLLEAKELANKDVTGRSDPYVVLFVQRADHLTKKSQPLHDTSDPIWNEEFLFKIQDVRTQKLTIKVMNWDDDDLDVCVGTAEFPISQLKESIQEEAWIDLVGDPEKLHEKYAGQIHIRLEFRSQDAFAKDPEPVPASFARHTATFSFPESYGSLKLEDHNPAFLEGLKAALGTSDDITCPKIASTRDMKAEMIKELHIFDARNGNPETIGSNKEDSKNVNVLDERNGIPQIIDRNHNVDSTVSVDDLKDAAEESGSAIPIVTASEQSLSETKFQLIVCKDDNGGGTGSVYAMSIDDEVLSVPETGLDTSILSGERSEMACRVENLEICHQGNMGSVLFSETNSCTSKCNSEPEDEFQGSCTEAAIGSRDSKFIRSEEESCKGNSDAELENRAHSSGRQTEDDMSDGNPAQQIRACWNIHEDMFDSELFEVD